MTKQKILTILTLLMWITGIQVSQATYSIDNKLNNNKIYEFSNIQNKTKRESSLNNEVKLNNENIDSINYLISVFDENIQNKVFSYLKKDISLTNLKKELNNNLQKRRKIHKNLVYEYSNSQYSEEYLQAITSSWLKIDKISKIKNMFLNKV